MKIIGIGKPDEHKNQVVLCELSEIEMDKVTGAAGKGGTPHRYKAGVKVNLSKIYNNVKRINENMDAIKAAAAETKTNADEIEKSFPLET